MIQNDQHDPLKALLSAAPAAQVPQRDLAFSLEVMAKVERRRLMESIAWTIAGAAAACLLLALIMPYLTPAIAGFGRAVAPVCAVLVALGLCWYLFEQTQRFFKI